MFLEVAGVWEMLVGNSRDSGPPDPLENPRNQRESTHWCQQLGVPDASTQQVTLTHARKGREGPSVCVCSLLRVTAWGLHVSSLVPGASKPRSWVPRLGSRGSHRWVLQWGCETRRLSATCGHSATSGQVTPTGKRRKQGYSTPRANSDGEYCCSSCVAV